jgi:hypothetical protein
MAHQNLTSTGIVTGQIVEADQITQFVNAFTGQPVGGIGYDITISGSLNLTGSLLMTGSLINEFSGQFSSLGLGVAAPTAPTMLHIKDTSVANDPIALLEAPGGTDSARIRFQNADVTYDVGAYGSSGDSFMIIQDQNSAVKFPVIIAKDTDSYTLMTAATKVGIGLGASMEAITTPLPAGSLQALGTISGSEIDGGVISASAAGVNIHGTASHAENVVTSSTGSYVKLGNIDMSGANTSDYSASANFNTSFDIISTSNIKSNKFQLNNGADSYADYLGQTLISGSAGGYAYFGSVADGSYIKIGGTSNEIKIDSGGQVNIEGNDIDINGLLRVSGSQTAGAPRIVIGPPSGIPGSNNPSSSLFHESLRFYKSGDTVVGNYNTDAGASLSFRQGGSSRLKISSSGDLIVSESLQILNQPSVVADDLRCTYKYGDSQNHVRMLFESNGGQTSGNSAIPLWNWDPNNSAPGLYRFKYSVLGFNSAAGTNTTHQAYFNAEQLCYWSGTQFTEIGENTVTSILGSFSSVTLNLALGPGSSTVEVAVQGQSGYTIQWKLFAEIEAVIIPSI